MKDLQNNNNVYILGAGFSAEYGMPLISGFMHRMRDAADWWEKQSGSTQVASLAKVFSFLKTAASAAHRVNVNIDNVEQLFSLAAAVDLAGLNNAMKESIAATLEFCRSSRVTYPDPHRVAMKTSFLKQFPSRLVSWVSDSPIVQDDDEYFYVDLDLYDYTIGTMLGRFNIPTEPQTDTIVTFNYDLVVEESLRDLGIKFNYGIPTAQIYPGSFPTKADGISVLKLHGSTNWGFRGGRGTRLQIFDDYHSATANTKTKLITPPTWQKEFTGYLSTIWGTAVRAISEATRVVIIGFSIPETDTHFKYLLAAGLKENISLREVLFINPLEPLEFEYKLRQLFPPSQLAGTIVSHLSLDTRSCFAKRVFLNRINREPSELL